MVLRELSGDEHARDLYERREKALRDERSRINGVRREIATKALQMNMRIEDITALTGLAYEEIEEIRAKVAKRPES